MGREVRMVPKNWKHPTDGNGEFIPLQGDYCDAMKWYQENKHKYKSLEEPKPEDHMPVFETGTATHYMMYETCTEGTPISPAFATPEELAHWLADNNASAFGYQGAPYEAWLRTIHNGFAVSCVINSNGVQSGVEAGI